MKQELAAEYIEKISQVMADFLEESKGKSGDVWEEIAKKHTRRIDTLLRNYEHKLADL